MSLNTLYGIGIKGIAACVPREDFDSFNYDYFTPSEASDFVKHVGVKSKRWSKGRLTTADLCYTAAHKLIAKSGWSPEEIRIVVMVTQTPDYSLPSSSIILQARLGLSASTLAFDVNLGCSGWVYGLSIVGGLMNALNIRKGLLLTGETCTICNYADKKTFPLMGEAGTATILERDTDSVMLFDLNSNGIGHTAIIAPDSGARHQVLKPGSIINSYVMIDTQKVLEFCLREVTPSVNRVLEEAGLSVEDMDYIVLHQANRIINDSLRKRLKIPKEKFPYSMEKYGNTSSASIPLTICNLPSGEIENKNANFLCSGFGVGLSWGTVLFKVNNLLRLPIIEA